MKISLVGFTGVGKTQVGRILAESLKIPFYDLDNILEVKTNQSVTEILGKYGIETFRDMESQALAELLNSTESFVIATGGGSLKRPTNRTHLRKNTKAVWLRGQPESIWHRIQDKPYVAPLFFTRQDPLMAIRIEMGSREMYYQEVSDITIDIDGKAPDIVAKEIRLALNLPA
ncbi:MAG: shikimate kinase [Elusimicrobia bacterium]|nr:shikimate kinase [Elusimicrobiota bacterium]